MKKLFIGLTSILLSSVLNAQNPSWILAPNYKPNMGSGTPPILLPTSPSGYQGQPAYGGQNIILNTESKIVFFIVDQYIYGRNGELIDELEISTYPIECRNGEIAVVPDPVDCNIYHILSSKIESPSIQVSTGYYAKLRVSYDSEGNVNANSGLLYSDIEDCSSHVKRFEDMIGVNYLSDNGSGSDPHDELPKFAVAPLNGGVYKVFIKNGRKIFRFTISENAFTYDNYFTHLIDDVYPDPANAIDASDNHRTELEVVVLPNGNLRLATAVQLFQFAGQPSKSGLFVLDFDANGNYITGSQKLCDYLMSNYSNPDYSKITGLELSPNGENVFVSHIGFGPNNATLDVWNLNGATPVKTELSSNPSFSIAQIETGVGSNLYVPSQNFLAEISSPNTTPTIDETAIAIGSYNTASIDGAIGIRMLQDQIDGMDYSDIDPNVYDAFIYEVTGALTQTWTPNTIVNSYNNNPLIYGLGNVAKIERELRIPAGFTLTIENMNIEFAPDARVVIENGTGGQQGGKLILNNSVFTLDRACENDEIWLGVEVWGNQNQGQGNIVSSTQGRLIMTNSTIEHAQIGVLVSRRQTEQGAIDIYTTFCEPQLEDYLDLFLPFTFIEANNGGIVQATNSSFINNQTGVYFRPYLPLSGANNLSKFTTSSFRWDDYSLVNAAVHARLRTVKGIRFNGCEFLNVSTLGNSNYQVGFGINSFESQFYATAYCPTIVLYGEPCPNPVPCQFTSLNFGIFVINVNELSFTCSENIFTDNRHGVYVRNTKKERIIRNKFEIRESDVYQSSGIAMYNSSEYKVWENELYEFDNPLVLNGTAKSYGIIVNSSGPVTNEIYKNDFNNLKVGGQTEYNNAVEITPTNQPDGNFNMQGLQWKCNDFIDNIESFDLTLMNGRMNYFQGMTGGATLTAVKRNAANNKFSLTSEPIVDAHDFYVSDFSQRLLYTYLNAPRHEPDSYTTVNNLSLAVITKVQSLAGGIPILTDNGACPSKINSKIKVLSLAKVFQLRNEADSLRNLIDNGNSQVLLQLIESGENGDVKNVLLDASPYLSDEVLIEYIHSNPPLGNLKQVLMANSQLSELVKAELVNYDMPNGTANQIAEVQNGLSDRSKLYAQISYLSGESELEYSDLISYFLLDDSDTANIENVIDILKEVQDYDRLKLLLGTYITIDDTTRAATAREELLGMNPCPYFIEMTEIKEEISSKRDIKNAMIDDHRIVSRLENVRDNSTDEKLAYCAKYLLDEYSDTLAIPEFLTDDVNKSQGYITESNEIDLHRSFSINIYPNPSTGFVNFDYPNQKSGTLEIQILNLEGKVMEERSAINTNGERIDLSLLTKGFYLVKIKIDGQILEIQKLELF